MNLQVAKSVIGLSSFIGTRLSHISLDKLLLLLLDITHFFLDDKLLLDITHFFLDGKLLAHATGFFVKWDGERKVGKLLTSAHIICSKYPSIHDSSGTREYATDAQVRLLSSSVYYFGLKL